eukprot:gb/GECG01014162.1/.p1 GENE.gb/GECG01014162.1/~~gb/GECG01014162.1/.p1  ORF type:complete len:295 (+),score=46.58 gb/GECG01014162.1/:1-885(+)
MASIISKIGGNEGGLFRKALIVFLGALVWRTVAKAIFGPERDVTKVTIFGGGVVLVALQLWQTYSDGTPPRMTRPTGAVLPGAPTQPASRLRHNSQPPQQGEEERPKFSKSTRGKENSTLRKALVSEASDERWDYQPVFRRKHKARYSATGASSSAKGNVGKNGLYLGRSKHQIERIRNRLSKKPSKTSNTVEDVHGVQQTASNPTMDEGGYAQENQVVPEHQNLREILEAISQEKLVSTFEEEELTSLELLCRMKNRDTDGFERKLEGLGMKKLGHREMFIQALCDWEVSQLR